MYSNTKVGKADKTCAAIMYQTTIFPDGRMPMCCYDYECRHGFGNVFVEGLKHCLDNEKRTNMQKAMIKGVFAESADLCKACDGGRWG